MSKGDLRNAVSKHTSLENPTNYFIAKVKTSVYRFKMTLSLRDLQYHYNDWYYKIGNY